MKDTKRQPLNITNWLEQRKFIFIYIKHKTNPPPILFSKDIPTRIKSLLSASVCTRCVTSPAKQYDMYQLGEAIKHSLEEANNQTAIISQ